MAASPSLPLFKRLKRQLSAIRLPAIGAPLRAGLEAITPRASYEDDFPSRRWPLLLLGSLSGFVGVVLIWSLLARTEIAVSSEGRLRPAQAPTRSRAQASSASSQIFVKEGDYVTKGQAVLQLDDVPLRARLDALENRYARGYLQLRETARVAGLPMPAQLPPPRRLDNLDLSVIQSTLDASRSQSEKAAQLKAQLRQAQVRAISLRQNISLQTVIVQRHQALKASGAIAELQLLQQQQRLSDLEADLASNLEDQQRMQSALRESVTEFSGRTSQSRG